MKKILALILAALMLGVLAAATFAAGSPFTDVKESRWSYGSVIYAVDKGYMKGTGEKIFSPAASLTRAMVVTVLWRRQGSPEPSAPSGFSDVKAGKYYTDAVAWSKETGVVNGVTPTEFRPNDDITREQLATMLYRYSSTAAVTVSDRADLAAFPDGSAVSRWAKEAMSWAVAAGLIKGMDDGSLLPKGKATREQFAAIMERYDNAFILKYNDPVLKSNYTEPEYPLVEDADFYASPNGDDANPGTFDAPVRTFEKAAELARGKEGAVVAFMAGDYGPTSVTLTAENKNDVFCAYGDGEPIFNNGVTLRGEDFLPVTESESEMFPEGARDRIKKLNLDEYFPDGMPEGLAIFGENGLIWEARYPNKHEGADQYLKWVLKLPEDAGPNYYGMEIEILPPLSTRVLNKAKHLDGVKLTGYIMFGWRVDSFYLEDYDKDTHIFTIDEARVPGNNPGDYNFWEYGIRTPQMKLDEVYVENSPDFLDDRGEYWYDPDTNNIYVYEPEEEYSVGLGGNFVTLNDADGVTLRKLTFENNRDVRAVTIQGADHVTVDRCAFRGVYSALEAYGDCDFLTVTGCDMSRFVATTLLIRPTGHRSTLEPHHVLIDNNYFHDYGLSKIFSNQAIVDNAIGTVISHNVFRNSPNGAINLGTLSVIEYNVFDNMMTSTQDFGIIYTWNAISGSRKNTIRYNLFENMQNNGQTYGVYMDDFSQDQEIYGNLFVRCGACGVMLHGTRDMFVSDNIFVESACNTNGFGFFENGKLPEGLLPDGTGWEDLYRRYYLNRVNEGEAGYEIWKETFPSLYAFLPDVDNPTDYHSIFCPWDSIHDNAFIGNSFNPAEDVVTWGDVHDNNEYQLTENPFFVNPTAGDYTIRDDAEFFHIPYDQIGQY